MGEWGTLEYGLVAIFIVTILIFWYLLYQGGKSMEQYRKEVAQTNINAAIANDNNIAAINAANKAALDLANSASATERAANQVKLNQANQALALASQQAADARAAADKAAADLIRMQEGAMRAILALNPKYKCDPSVYGGLIAVRRNMGGDIECVSNDGRSCIISTNITECNRLADISWQHAQTTKNLTCGAPHKAIFGSTGYDTTGHWCNTANAFFIKEKGGTPANAQIIRCNELTPTAVIANRINEQNNVECVSSMASGKLGCQIYPSKAACQAAIPTITVVNDPLICGAPHQALYGSTGYDQPTHWCNTARALFS